jgi:predicted nucleic acid-binding Zn ribbon protein
MILVDLFCPECDSRKIDVFVDMKQPMPKCDECNAEMKQLISRMSFKLVYDNRNDSCGWSNDGYASSQYWKKIKEDRANGIKSEEPISDKSAKWL